MTDIPQAGTEDRARRNRVLFLILLAAAVIIGWSLYAMNRRDEPTAGQPFKTYPSDSTETTSSDPTPPTQGINSNGNGEVPGRNGMPVEDPVTDR